MGAMLRYSGRVPLHHGRLVTRVWSQFTHSMRVDGPATAFRKAVYYSRALLEQRRHRREIFAHDDIEQRFSVIHDQNYWRSAETVSGSGSTLAATENLRKELPALFERFSIHSVFDAPCGDFSWMREVVAGSNITYHGADIVRSLVEANRAAYANERTTFSHLDITRAEFPHADLWLCRDSLFHLSNEDIARALDRFANSSIDYMLATTHINTNGFRNFDIATGDCRLLDLFAAPHSLPTDVGHRIIDYRDPDPPREMCLWSRPQIAATLADR